MIVVIAQVYVLKSKIIWCGKSAIAMCEIVSQVAAKLYLCQLFNVHCSTYYLY